MLLEFLFLLVVFSDNKLNFVSENIIKHLLFYLKFSRQLFTIYLNLTKKRRNSSILIYDTRNKNIHKKSVTPLSDSSLSVIYNERLTLRGSKEHQWNDTKTMIIIIITTTHFLYYFLHKSVETGCSVIYRREKKRIS